jgi:hypothetical protein
VESTVLSSGDNKQGSSQHVQCPRMLLQAGLSFAIRIVPLLLLVALLFTQSFPGLPDLLAHFIPGLFPSVMVTIIPASANLHITTTITAVTGTPHISHHEVQARLLLVTTTPKGATVPTTGKGYRSALRAMGSVTFYNQLTAPQTIASGTVLTGNDGARVVTEQVAIIPAALPPVEGQVTVPAHALQAGPRGNISARDINTLCCAAGVAVQNLVDFTGGKRAREYPAVSRQDLEDVSESLTARLTRSAQSAFQAQVQLNEQEVRSAQCASVLRSDHPVGSEATHVTVSVVVTCRGEVYDAQGAKALAVALLSVQVVKCLGSGYGNIGA